LEGYRWNTCLGTTPAEDGARIPVAIDESDAARNGIERLLDDSVGLLSVHTLRLDPTRGSDAQQRSAISWGEGEPPLGLR